jgi:prepilin-type N-terminal cleavage/methylation domain-containing protein
MKNKGFTLIELLIVIAILLILGLLGYGSFMAGEDAIERAKEEKQQEQPITKEPIQNEAVENAKKDWGNTL